MATAQQRWPLAGADGAGEYRSAFSPAQPSVTPPARVRTVDGTDTPSTSEYASTTATPIAWDARARPLSDAVTYVMLLVQVACLAFVAVGVDATAACARGLWRVNVAFLLVAMFLCVTVSRLAVHVGGWIRDAATYGNAIPLTQKEVIARLAPHHIIVYTRRNDARKTLKAGLRVRPPYQFAKYTAWAGSWLILPLVGLAVWWVVGVEPAGASPSACHAYTRTDAVVRAAVVLVAFVAARVEYDTLMRNFAMGKKAVRMRAHGRAR